MGSSGRRRRRRHGPPMPTPHDARFKRTFSQLEHAVGEARFVLPAAIGKQLECSTLTPGSSRSRAASSSPTSRGSMSRGCADQGSAPLIFASSIVASRTASTLGGNGAEVEEPLLTLRARLRRAERLAERLRLRGVRRRRRDALRRARAASSAKSLSTVASIDLPAASLSTTDSSITKNPPRDGMPSTAPEMSSAMRLIAAGPFTCLRLDVG